MLAIPGPIDSARSSGCNLLIQQGAKLVQNFDDILEELSPMYRGAVKSGLEPASDDSARGLLPDEQALLDLLDGANPAQLDALADRAPFGFARVQAALFGLEVRRVIESHPGGYYSRAKRAGRPTAAD